MGTNSNGFRPSRNSPTQRTENHKGEQQVTWHPTTNCIPFGLLTKEQQAALKSWPHGWGCFTSSCGWSSRDDPMWSDHLAYRGKPAPVVTSVWFNRYRDKIYGPYSTREEADDVAGASRIDVLRIDTCNDVSTAHLEGLKDER